MYHEKTDRYRTRRRRRLIAIAAILALLAVAAFAGYSESRDIVRQQSALSVRNSILETANRCCAIEGAYPSSLDYLEEEYGLRVNHADFVITYEIFASNVAPSVAVIPR